MSLFVFSACLYESIESSCHHFDVGVGVGDTFKFYVKVFYVIGKVLSV